MNIKTKYFGEMECKEEEILFFPEGMPGFEGYRRYVIIRLDNDDDALLCLQSLEEEQLAFVVANPFYVDSNYQPRLTDPELALLKCGPKDALAFYVIAVLKDEVRETTFNLKCPIAVNPVNRLAIQIVMEDDRYSMRHKISSAESAGDNFCAVSSVSDGSFSESTGGNSCAASSAAASHGAPTPKMGNESCPPSSGDGASPASAHAAPHSSAAPSGSGKEL